MTYHTFQQLPPRQIDGEWQPHIPQRDDVEAASEEAAIAIAKLLPVFKRASGLARFPMVEEA